MTTPDIRRFVLLALAMLQCVALAATRCDLCRREIKGNRYRVGDMSYCSKQCFEASLPKCHVCNSTIRSSHVVSQGNHYCSQKCFRNGLPKCELCGQPTTIVITMAGHRYCKACSDRPTCFNCLLPFREGVQLPDNRAVCSGCDKDLVLDEREAVKLYERAVRDVEAVTGLRSATRPPLKLVSQQDMLRQSSKYRPADNSLVQQGLYERHETTTVTKNVFGRVIRRKVDVEEMVLVLYGLPAEKFIATCCHELTHDIIAEHFSDVTEAPLWAEEGICQYVAATVCRRNKFGQALAAIEGCTDPSYGDGYRFIKKLAGDNQWRAVRNWMKTIHVKQLPRTAPGE